MGRQAPSLPLGQPNTLTEPLRQRAGQGRVVCLPSLPLPQSPNNGLPPADAAKISTLPDLLDWAANRDLPAYVQASDQVEVTVAYDRKSKLLVHLVNYGVDLNGKLSPVKDLPVAVRLPAGMEVVGPGKLYTPELPAPQRLGQDEIVPGRALRWLQRP